MKRAIFLIICLVLAGTALTAKSSEDTAAVRRVGVKLNSAVLVGIVNPAVEFSVRK